MIILRNVFVRADGRANNAATVHTPQIGAGIIRHVGCEETRTCKGFTVTLYRWMLSTATEYTDRPTDRRRQNGRNLLIMAPSDQLSDILLAQASVESTVK